jgi:hypothetical protein
MILKYPAPDEDGFVLFLAASEFPPDCIDSETTSVFRVYCRVRAFLHFICPTEMSQLKGPVVERSLEPQVELPPTSFDAVERSNDLLEFAFEHPVDFLGHASDVLEAAVDQIPDDALAAEESRLELQAYVRTIPRMQRIVKKRFASALCP